MEWRAVVKDRITPGDTIVPPTALIIADTWDGAVTAADAFRACEADTAAAIDLHEAEAQLDRQSSLKIVALELREDHGALLDRLLTRLNQVAAKGDVAVIVSMPLELVDCIVARIDNARVTMLCQPDPLERVSAIATALAELDGRLYEMRELDGLRLRRLADEVNRIARVLSSLSASSHGGQAARPAYSVSDAAMSFSAEPTLAPSTLPTPDDVRRLIRMRRLRDSFFRTDLFADPAWDMLLDLFAAHIEGDRVAVSSLCIAAAVPQTTALRWITTMVEAGLFVRQADPLDGRRIFIQLSEAAGLAMARYFAAIRRYEGVAI
jgi:Winged helix DNA-binding domain